MPDFPVLTFLPVERLLIHEWHDDQRTAPLMRRIRASGIFRNPPVVAPLEDGTQRYMVLDGANRVTALKELDFPHALVQVVQPDDPGLGLHCWNHVIWELNPARFLEGIRAIPGIDLSPDPPQDFEPRLEGECGLAIVLMPDNQSFSVCSETNSLKQRVDLLNALVRSYQQRARLDRTSQRDVPQMRQIYPSFCGLVIYPTFNIHDLLRLVSENYLLPAGITRFTISPRALHLNYPLSELASDQPIEEKNQALSRWIQDRLAHKGVRYYAEPTYLFDE
jgi:L-serine kinase (ATP) / ParB family transcriptional regulator, heme-responsive regulator